VTESTFGLPIFRWEPEEAVLGEMNTWWRNNKNSGRTSILFAYSLGKAQRIIAGLDSAIGPIFTHGAVENINVCYRDSLVSLPVTQYVGSVADNRTFEGAMVIAPPSSDTPGWMKKFPNHSRGFASGWMRIRGNRRRRSLDRGFVLSDHSDWEGILNAVSATGAETVWVTHGYTAELVRWLQENGWNAKVVETRFPDIEDDTE
jgi:putative mRNA 3-end processing factor